MDDSNLSQTYSIGVIGAGLAGSMTALLLSNLGFAVTVFERRPDSRSDDDNTKQSTTNSAFGTSTSAVKRSINLALSHRGMEALKEVGLLEAALVKAIPMSGRVIHNGDGSMTRQAYGTADQVLNSISRQDLNNLLLNHLILRSKQNRRILVLFGYLLKDASVDGKCIFEQVSEGKSCTVTFTFDLVIGADGAYSSVRDNLLRQGRVDFSRKYVAHGYKELHIPAAVGPDGRQCYALPNHQGLHIWPRKDFMLIALPNADCSFTATLFAPYHGQGGFDSIDSSDDTAVENHFRTYFPDALAVMPNLAADYRSNPVGSLLTVRVRPWNQGRMVLVGDAAHAVVPFYGQGMNAAFEDSLVLYSLLKAEIRQKTSCGRRVDLEYVASCLSNERGPSTDGLAQLCEEHYADMAANTASPVYLFIRRVEGFLHSLFPSFVPLYTMVTFTRIPYHIALQRANRQEAAVRNLILGVGALITSPLYLYLGWSIFLRLRRIHS